MDTDIKELLVNLIDQAETSKNVEFRYIRSWKEYREVHKAYKYKKAVTKLLQASAETIFKKYCKEVSKQSGQFNKLLVYRSIALAADFYTKDVEIIYDMLDEYETYLITGNFLDLLTGSQRPFNKFWDHRSL